MLNPSPPHFMTTPPIRFKPLSNRQVPITHWESHIETTRRKIPVKML